MRSHVENSEILLEWAYFEHKRGADVAHKVETAINILLDIEKDEDDK